MAITDEDLVRLSNVTRDLANRVAELAEENKKLTARVERLERRWSSKFELKR